MSKSIIKQKRILTKAAGGSSLATPVSVANGGTGLSSYTIGDLIYASGATTLSKLADIATGNALISGGVGTAPSWGKIGLTTHITGGNWKTIYTNGSGVVTELALGSSGQVLQSNGASSAPTWVTPSSGITVGTTTITSGTSGRIPYNNAGVYGEQANLSIGLVASGYLDVPTGYAIAGAKVLTTGSASLYCGTSNSISSAYIAAFGYEAHMNGQSGRGGTFIGFGAGRGAITGVENIALGAAANYGGGTFSYSLFIGSSSSSSSGMSNTASNQAVIGMPLGGGYQQFYLGQGITSASPAGVTLNATGGSGTDNAGGSFTIAGGKGTGAGTPGQWIVQTSTTLGTGTTLQSLVSRLTISGGAVTTDASTATWADKLDFVFNTGTGTKFGTATTQKIGFWNVTPIVQPSGATQAAPAAYATGDFGLDSDANMQALYDLVVAMRTALVNVGIMKGSA